MEKIFELYRELRGLFSEKDLGAELHQQIHRIIQDTIDRIPDGSRIAIRPAGGDTEEILKQYDLSRKNIIGIVDRKKGGDNFCGYPCFTMDDLPVRSYDCVMITSYTYRQAIKLELDTLHIPYIDFYDELEKQGIRLDDPHYYYESYPQLTVNYFYLRYLRSEAGSRRETALNELLQIAVENKDFVLISTLYQDCGGEDGEFPLLKTVWEKSKRLLDLLQNRFLGRKQKDIIVYWTDSVPYSKACYLPGTMELSKQGTFFQRVYGAASNTRQICAPMFRNMLFIDDFPQNLGSFEGENSPLIRFLEDEGYKYQFIYYSPEAMGKKHLANTRTFEPCTLKWWNAMVDLLQSPEPCFYIFKLMECHWPYYVPDLKEIVNYNVMTKTQWEERLKSSYGYLDRCLLLFHKLLGNKTQIFMSDHGIPGVPSEYPPVRAYDLFIRPYCFVVGENIPKLTVTRFFPYTNYVQFVRWIVDPPRFSLDDACTDEVVIQDIDLCESGWVTDVLRIGRPEYGLAYRGIVTYDYKYVINSLGDEFFYQMQPDGSEKLVPLEDPVLRAELRDKAGTKFIDIYQYDQFKLTRKLYDAIDQKRRGENI